MSKFVGITLLPVGYALVFLVPEGRDGTHLIPLSDWMFGIYPALCLDAIAFSVAMVVAGG